MWARRSAAVIAKKSTTVARGTGGARLRRRKKGGRKGRGGRRRCSCRDGGHGGSIAGNPLGPNGHEGCQEGDALGLGVVRAPPLDGVLLVHELHHRLQVVAGHGVVALVPAPLLGSRRSDLGLDELKGCCAERFGRVVPGFRQDGRLRRRGRPGRPADEKQVATKSS